MKTDVGVTKTLWHYIKSFRRDNSGGFSIKIKIKRENCVHLLQTKLTSWKSNMNLYWQKKILVPSHHLKANLIQRWKNIIVSEEGVKKWLSSLNPHKATDRDGLTNYVLFFIPPGRQCPRGLEKGLLFAIFRKGDRHSAANYRPVSLTSLCWQIQEYILTSNIRRHLADYNILKRHKQI